MQSTIEKDTVQDLYDEIEHLIDVPLELFSSNKGPKDFHYKEYHKEDEYYFEDEQQYGQENIQQQPEKQRHNEQVVSDSNNNYSFERPILIESDSDDIEEELAITPTQYSFPVCFKCNRPIKNQSTSNTLQPNSICDDCSKKKRSRSSSFTFTQLADKLKQSFGHSSSTSNNSNQLLAPAGIKNVDRRKSMPSMNSVFDHDQQQALAPPSPVPSRPSSRASSFIEDVKQFLAPLSRKSSRNSMHQEYQRSLSPTPPEGPKRKTSHSSLLDVINICKPSKPKRTPSYEKRLIYQPDEFNVNNTWTQEDEEVMGIHQQNNFLNLHQDQDTGFESTVHIPLRRKQIKAIESRQDRIDIYNNAFLDCMQMETNLVPWIIKQTQKGPPDAWFGYVPPERQPKKIMGIFKRKTKANDSGTSLRAQQQQLGDELLNRSTPLLQHRYSNSNMSTSPSNYTPESQLEFSTSPGAIGYDDEEEIDDDENDEEAEYIGAGYISSSQQEMSPLQQQQQQQQRSTLSSSLSPSSRRNSTYSPNNNNDYDDPPMSRPSSAQPVSILKKFNSNTSMQREYQQSYYNGNDEVLNYDDHDDEEDYYNYQEEQYQTLPPPVPQHRRRSSNSSDLYQQSMAMIPKDRRYPPSSTRGHSRMYDNDFVEPPQPMVSPRRGRSSSSMGGSFYHSEYPNREEDEYFDDYQYHQGRRSTNPTTPSRSPRHRQQHQYEEPIHNNRSYYNDSIAMSKKNMRKGTRQPRYYEDENIQHDQGFEHRYHPEEDEDEYYPPPPVTPTRRRSKPTTPNSSRANHSQDYYGMSVKMTPYMIEEWEIALDDLCELFPRLDRHYVNDFLRSAQGDFVAAKDMIMQMIMEIR